MTTYELFSLLLAAIAILTSLWTFQRQRADRERIQSLEQEVLTFELEERHREQEARTRADFTARLTRDPDEVLLINSGGAEADRPAAVLKLAKRPRVDVTQSAEATQRLVMDRLPPGGEWRIPVLLAWESMPPPLVVNLNWWDPDGTERTKSIPLRW